MANINTWLNAIPQLIRNPSAIQRLAYDTLDEVSGGSQDVVDATNPFVLLMQASAVNASAVMVQNEVLTRQQYPSMAISTEELYLHMSDKDYANRFASPALARMTILLGKAELMAKVLPTGVGEIKKLTIPRNTQFTVAGINFTMQYPIDIRVMAHGGLQIVYDNSQLSPLQTLETNIVEWEPITASGDEYIRIDIPVRQFTATTNYGQLNLAQGYSRSFSFTDQFYYARAYYSDVNGVWREMATTHASQVFDPLTPTMLFKVLDQQLQVTLPQIYLTTGLVTSEIRVDIYTTKGPLSMLLANYEINNFTVKWIDLDPNADTTFSAPLSSFTPMSVFSDDQVTGGSNAISFEALRQQVLSNAVGAVQLPITNAQLTSRMSNLGYDAVVDVDNITNRIILATRSLPAPADGSVITGAGCTIQTLQDSMARLVTQATVMDNGTRITVLPSTLYENVNGVLAVVADAVVNNLLALPIDARARTVNQSNYLYSPFHYVMDMSADSFDLRAYYLDSPVIETKLFVEENDTTGLEVGTSSFEILRTEAGYRITLVSKSGDHWKTLADTDVYCQLSFVPAGEKDRAYQNGSLVGMLDDERVWQFDIETNYDIDAFDNLILTSFQMYNDEDRKHGAGLLTEFDVMYIASGIGTTVGLESSNIDLDMGKALLPLDAVGVSRETLRVKLGDAMPGLWTNSRSVASSQDYQRWTADEIATYPYTIYATDGTGSPIITVDGNGDLSFEILHAKGDTILDDQGNPVYSHRAGDVMLDADQQPIVVSTRTLLRQCDLFLLDGVYWFATETGALGYKKALPVQVVGWLEGDIATLTSYLFEKSSLYFYPKATLGQVSAIIHEDQETSIPAGQSFQVTYYLSDAAYQDTELRAALTDTAIKTINDALQSATVTSNEITTALSDAVGGDAIGVSVTGLGGNLGLDVISLVDDSARLSIRKIAVALADGTIGVEDDVGVTFLRHRD